MRDGETIKTFEIDGVKAEIQQLVDLRFLVVYGFNEKVEQTAEEERADLIKVKNYENSPGNSYFYKSTKLGHYKKLPQLIEDIRLKKEKRKRIRRLTEKGVMVETERPVTTETFEEWLKLYDAMIENKEKGLRHANMEWFKRDQERLTGLFAYLDNELIGGTIVTLKEEEGERIASSAFKAAKEEHVKEGINDFLVYNFIIWTIKNGFKTIKSGVDMNFYGHYLDPGLFLFKREWGFKPKPTKEFEWIRFLNFEKFGDICFFISGKDQLECNLLLKREIGEEEEKKFRIEGCGFNKFMIYDNALIRRYA